MDKMKCVSCNERKSNTRCEGCQQLYCLPCMNTHHRELLIQLDLLFGVQNELKESFKIVESHWQHKKELPCLNEIDQWEQEVINRIQQIAAKARTTVNEMMTKNMSDIRHRLDQLAFDMQQRQQEGNYLDNDILEIRNQLGQINDSIQHMHEKIQINYRATNKIDWNSLIYVTSNNKLSERKFVGSQFDISEFQYDQESRQEKLWKNLRKMIRYKRVNNDHEKEHSNLKYKASPIFEPIVLTSFASSTLSRSKGQPEINSDSYFINDSTQNPFLNNEILNYVNFKAIGNDSPLPQSSDA